MPFVSKTLQYSFCACVRNILKIVMVVIEKMKLVSFSIYNMCKGRLGSRGEGVV